MHAGAHNAITDIPGILVGHAVVTGEDALSGATVVRCPRGGATAGVDVRGAAPGTRETDLLDPGNSVQRVHAVVLGHGKPFFNGPRAPLRLVASERVGEKAIRLTYVPA